MPEKLDIDDSIVYKCHYCNEFFLGSEDEDECPNCYGGNIRKQLDLSALTSANLAVTGMFCDNCKVHFKMGFHADFCPMCLTDVESGDLSFTYELYSDIEE